MRTHHRGIYLLAKHDTLTYDKKLQRNNNIYKDKNYVKNLGSSHMNNVNYGNTGCGVFKRGVQN